MPSEALAKEGFLYLFGIVGGITVMKYVYMLESISHPGKRYIGTTCELNKRFKEHNAGKSPHTSKYKPWKAVVAIRFSDEQQADAFEKYLKSGSGHAFAKKHFWYHNRLQFSLGQAPVSNRRLINVSVAAVCGLDGKTDAIRAVENKQIAGKMIVYPAVSTRGM